MTTLEAVAGMTEGQRARVGVEGQRARVGVFDAGLITDGQERYGLSQERIPR